uniref:p11.5 protein n=1 Tax=Southern bean mosaic virus TaxID=12139 RepID=Q83471_9VIRU|nr:p11.5 protein [Southern bean mosaic virus]
MSYRFLTVRAFGFTGFHCDATRLLSETEVIDVPTSMTLLARPNSDLKLLGPSVKRIVTRFSLDSTFKLTSSITLCVSRLCAESALHPYLSFSASGTSTVVGEAILFL